MSELPPSLMASLAFSLTHLSISPLLTTPSPSGRWGIATMGTPAKFSGTLDDSKALTTQRKGLPLSYSPSATSAICAGQGAAMLPKDAYMTECAAVTGHKHERKELELYRIFLAIDVEHNGCILSEELWDALVKVTNTIEPYQLSRLEVGMPSGAEEDTNGADGGAMRGGGGHEADGGNFESKELPLKVMQDILLRLPTKSVGRCSCISRQWLSAARDPSFCKLYSDRAHAHLVDEEPYLLLVAVAANPMGGTIISFYPLPSSGVCGLAARDAMWRIADPGGYSLTNMCNGLICFASSDRQKPPILWNPATGEKLELPRTRRLEHPRKNYFALGFAPSTEEYKVFCLSSPDKSQWSNEDASIDVYRLGQTGPWRRIQNTFGRHHLIALPLYANGKLCLVTVDGCKNGLLSSTPSTLIIVDVASEVCKSYKVPNPAKNYSVSVPLRVSPFELDGQLCLAVNVLEDGLLQIWVMSLDDPLSMDPWELRYIFPVHQATAMPDIHRRDAWFHGRILHYRLDNCVYSYDTRKDTDKDLSITLAWDHRTNVPLTWHQWQIHGGYQPSLFSLQKFLIDSLKLEWWKLENKLHYIYLTCEKIIKIPEYSREELVAKLQEKGFTPFPKKSKGVDVATVVDEEDYEYLLSMNSLDFTRDKIKDCSDKQERLQDMVWILIVCPHICLWMKDLDISYSDAIKEDLVVHKPRRADYKPRESKISTSLSERIITIYCRGIDEDELKKHIIDTVRKVLKLPKPGGAPQRATSKKSKFFEPVDDEELMRQLKVTAGTFVRLCPPVREIEPEVDQAEPIHKNARLCGYEFHIIVEFPENLSANILHKKKKVRRR